MATPLSAAQLAEALNVSEWAIGDWARRRLIPFSQIGRRRFFVLEDVLAATRQAARPRLVAVRGGTGDDFQAARDFARGGAVQSQRKKKAAR